MKHIVYYSKPDKKIRIAHFVWNYFEKEYNMKLEFILYSPSCDIGDIKNVRAWIGHFPVINFDPSPYHSTLGSHIGNNDGNPKIITCDRLKEIMEGVKSELIRK